MCYLYAYAATGAYYAGLTLWCSRSRPPHVQAPEFIIVLLSVVAWPYFLYGLMLDFYKKE